MASKENKIKKNNFDMNRILVDGEELLWKCSPSKKAYTLSKIFSHIVFILIWLVVDVAIITAVISADMELKTKIILLSVYMFHLIPVWLWLHGIVTASAECDNTVYYVTNKRIVFSTCVVRSSHDSVYFDKIAEVSLEMGIINRIFGLGDVYFYRGDDMDWFSNIENPYKVYKNVQKIIADAKSDMAFPNALRPDENLEYNSEYVPE